ncbi:MAG: glucose-6-phosphate isomerase [Alphaproteobacteria bacterium]|nr:glucose-6-phosphate isomerase [Alphaproteobacteria bacterium]
MKATSSPAWKALACHRDAMRERGFSVIAHDAERLSKYEIALNGLRLNYAFQNVTDETFSLLIALAEQRNIADFRDRMFAGEKINVTENRAVLHTALRHMGDDPVLVDGTDVIPEVRATQNRLSAFVDDVRNGKWKGATGKPFRTVVNIGIGGSDLGPRLVVQALKPFGSDLDVHFVANVDAFEIEKVLKKADPAETLFLYVSKSFTTLESALNAQTARKWIVDHLGEAAVKNHFVAVSVNLKAVEEFGIHADNVFPMWDWVGGRYSVWSAVGLSVALAIGQDNFRNLLRGAAAMDEHFKSAPLAVNMPVILGLLGIWNRNFLGSAVYAILPYSERLRDLPRFLQQLEMESNGKSVTREGEPVDYATVPAIFGECGTVGQHSFMQCFHQGTDAIPSDFIAVASDDLDKPGHHHALLSNLAAQMGALWFGQPTAAKPQDIYPGNRPSTLIRLEKLDPFTLGMLLALYEHKVFVQGAIWNINSFDQPGVELGKRMAKALDKEAPLEGVSEAVTALFKIISG